MKNRILKLSGTFEIVSRDFFAQNEVHFNTRMLSFFIKYSFTIIIIKIKITRRTAGKQGCYFLTSFLTVLYYFKQNLRNFKP